MKAKLEMKHQDLVDSRNALFIAQFTVPFAILALPSQLNLVGNTGFLLVVAFFSIISYDQIQGKKLVYNMKLEATRREIDKIIKTLSKSSN